MSKIVRRIRIGSNMFKHHEGMIASGTSVRYLPSIGIFFLIATFIEERTDAAQWSVRSTNFSPELNQIDVERVRFPFRDVRFHRLECFFRRLAFRGESK